MSTVHLWQITGVPEKKGHDPEDPATTGLYFEPKALLGYAANVLQHVYGDQFLAEAVRDVAEHGAPKETT